jgi:hypothetical protein
MEWKSFQEDFWKVFSVMGLNQTFENEPVQPAANDRKQEKDQTDQDDENEAPTQTKDERDPNDIRKRAAAEAAMVRERNADWVKGGVWDSRVQHPVPAYPVHSIFIHSYLNCMFEVCLDQFISRIEYRRECSTMVLFQHCVTIHLVSCSCAVLFQHLRSCVKSVAMFGHLILQRPRKRRD